MGYDKYLARNKKRRISENTLLFCFFFGGAIGGIISMLFFKHKTSKKIFIWKLYVILLIQFLIMLALLSTRNFSNPISMSSAFKFSG